MFDGLLVLFKVLRDSLCTEAFAKSMRECFVRVGLAKDAAGKFVVFSYAKKGVLKQLIPPAAVTGSRRPWQWAMSPASWR